MTNADKLPGAGSPNGNKGTEEGGIYALETCDSKDTEILSASNNGYQCKADPPPYSLQSEPASEGSKCESCSVVTAILIAVVLIVVVTGIPIYLLHKCKHGQTRATAMIDACLSECDKKGGWCNQTDGYFFCQCNDGYNGTNCERNIDECASDPCQNAGKCVDVINGYVCQCGVGYQGVNCQETEESPRQSTDDECYTQNNGADYRGSISTTETGRTCQRWMSQTPHGHLYIPSSYPNGGLGDHNYCRNPDGPEEHRTWCFTMDGNVRWEYCDIGDPQDSCGVALTS